MQGEAGVTSVSIPLPLFRKIEERIQGTDFESVSSYVTYLLQEIIAETEKADAKEPFSKDEEEAVKQRLRALGYIE